MTGSRKYNFKCQSFPNTIEQERRRRGWTVTKLAELSGVSRYSIAAYETWAAGGIAPKQQMKSVTDTTAQMIADALEVTPEQLFKHYAEAAAEHKPRVKPFSTRAERDGAILKALEPAKYTALKMCGVLQCRDVWCEMDDVIAIAYETVVEVAEEALERGIAAGVCFDAIACGAVKKKFLRLRKYYGEKCKKADLVSYEAYFPLHDPASSYCLEDRYELREECREAVRTLSPERRRDPYIAELLEAIAL